jgi:hypothetical protein
VVECLRVFHHVGFFWCPKIRSTLVGNGSIGDHNPNDGPATAADLGYDFGIAVDRARKALYFGDTSQNWVSKVELATGGRQ